MAQTKLSLQRLVHNSALTLAQQAATALCSFATSVVLARALGPQGQGEYGVVFALASLTMTLGNLGVGQATVYFVGHGTFPLAVAWRQNCWLAALLGATAAAGLGLCIVGYGPSLVPHVPQRTALYAAAMVPQLLLTHVLICCLQGAQRFKAYNVATLLAPLLTLIGAGTLVAAAHAGTLGALLAYSLGQSGAAALAWYYLRDAGPAAWRPNAAYARTLIRYGAAAYLSNALSYLNYRIDVLLLNAWVGSTVVGIYSIAVGVGERIWLLSYAASAILLPHVAQGGDPEKFTPVVARHIVWLTAAAGLGLASIAPWVIPWIFGPSYAAAVQPLWALLPGLVVFSLGRVLSNAIAGSGRPGINAAVGCCTLALNVAGNCLLIGPYGALGASVASSIAYTCDTGLKVWIYCRSTKVHVGAVLLPQAADVHRLQNLWRRYRA